MRVLVNRYAEVGRKTGIGHYTAELVRHLRCRPDVHLETVPGDRLYSVHQSLSHARQWFKPATFGCGWEQPQGTSARLWQRARNALVMGGRQLVSRSLCAEASRHRCQIYHEPNFIPLPIDLPTVVTVHDLSVLIHPEWHPVDRVAYFERRFTREIFRCQHVVAVSETTRQDVIRALGLPAERVTRTYNGVRRGMQPLPRLTVQKALRELGLPDNYLLYLGTLEPRKNLLILLRAYCALPANYRERWPLVLIGSWGWGAAPLAQYLHDEARHNGVRHVGYVADKHLPALYNGARALVYPSFYEGFGLPPVEMLACGGAVLASTAGAIAETVGGQAHLVAPEDVDGWRAAMLRVVTDDDWWQSLRLGAQEKARPFTWEQCAADTLSVYQKVCGLPVEAEPFRKAG